MDRKKIRIAFVDFWKHWNPEDNFITNTLRLKYDVEISASPDYIFYSNFNRFFDHVKYDNCVKIFYTQENLCPDFNFADYGIGFEELRFGDRYLRYPICYIPERYGTAWHQMAEKHLISDVDKCINREFCSFVVSNDSANEIRLKIFDEIGKYKRVNSGGKYMNNIGIPTGIPNKIKFESQHKFSICFENSRHPGYMTEKLIEAFAAGTVPIYWGDPNIGELFNKGAFIDVGSFDKIEDAVDYVRKVDQNDDLYIKMILVPALKSEYEDKWAQKQNELDEFLGNIFVQDKNEAFRRNREFWGKIYTDNIRNMRNVYKILLDNWALRVIRNKILGMKEKMKKVLIEKRG